MFWKKNTQAPPLQRKIVFHVSPVNTPGGRINGVVDDFERALKDKSAQFFVITRKTNIVTPDESVLLGRTLLMAMLADVVVIDFNCTDYITGYLMSVAGLRVIGIKDFNLSSSICKTSFGSVTECKQWMCEHVVMEKEYDPKLVAYAKRNEYIHEYLKGRHNDNDAPLSALYYKQPRVKEFLDLIKH